MRRTLARILLAGSLILAGAGLTLWWWNPFPISDVQESCLLCGRLRITSTWWFRHQQRVSDDEETTQVLQAYKLDRPHDHVWHLRFGVLKQWFSHHLFLAGGKDSPFHLDFIDVHGQPDPLNAVAGHVADIRRILRNPHRDGDSAAITDSYRRWFPARPSTASAEPTEAPKAN